MIWLALLLRAGAQSGQAVLLSLTSKLLIHSDRFVVANLTNSDLHGFGQFASTRAEFGVRVASPNVSEQFDLLRFDSWDFTAQFGRYEQDRMHIKQLYDSYQACEQPYWVGGDVLEHQTSFTQQLQPGYPTTLVLDNTLFPCTKGVYFPQVELLTELRVIVEPKEAYYYGMQVAVVLFVGTGAILLAGVGINLYRVIQTRRRMKELMKRRNIVHEPLLPPI